ncbi:cupin domain-containing protein [Pseudomonas sp. ADAK13]|uniref:cupin domain-containing protein n=1 Tax=Pseudomonas sp. ADAK13 TaxID=2730847 RepID=UPI001F1649F5|nr:cupin domain-containing protein [Pseudomonas sp. ADAK13]
MDAIIENVAPKYSAPNILSPAATATLRSPDLSVMRVAIPVCYCVSKVSFMIQSIVKAACLTTFIVASAVAPLVQAQPLPLGSTGALHNEDVEWRSFPAFPKEVKLSVLVGDPSKPAPYVVRVKVPNGTKLMPHTHPEDRIYTVMSGVFYIGFGTVFDSTKLVAYGPGSVVVLPANTPHFHWAKSGEYISQVYGTGPLGLEYIDSHDDPRNSSK